MESVEELAAQISEVNVELIAQMLYNKISSFDGNVPWYRTSNATQRHYRAKAISVLEIMRYDQAEAFINLL